MLRIAGATVVLITVLESLALYPFMKATPLPLGMALAAFNLVTALFVGYLVFNSLPAAVPPGGGQPREGTLRIVQDTLPILRQGLNQETAAKTAEIVAKLDYVQGVLVADRQGVLAVAGPGWRSEAHRAQVRKVAGDAISRGVPRVGRIQVPRGTIPQEAVAVPLRSRNEVVGALALLTDSQPNVVADLSRTAELFAQLLSMQIELGQLDRQAQLAAEAELNALRAQINPHFLFNTLNTIISYSRDDPEMTRRLLLRLADLFRTTMQLSGQIIPFSEEYQHVRDYLFIEQARFRDKLRVTYDIDPQVLKVGIPALSVQPLVENAVRHGLAPKQNPGTVDVSARLDFLTLRVIITVRDDGVGIPAERIPDLLRPRAPAPQERGRGVGLSNINERLKRLYGDAFRLKIESKPGHGTKVSMRIPMR